MLSEILPPTINNTYHGAPAGKITFAAITLLTFGRSVVHILAADGGAQSIATIPLDTYPSDASATVVAMFAQWGLSQLLMALMYLVVLWRYQSLVPLMWLFVLLEWGGRLMLGMYKPIETRETPPGVLGNYIFTALALVMLPLSCRQKTRRQAKDGKTL